MQGLLVGKADGHEMPVFGLTPSARDAYVAQAGTVGHEEETATTVPRSCTPEALAVVLTECEVMASLPPEAPAVTEAA